MNNNFAGKPTAIAFSTLLISISLTTATYAAENYICEAKQNSKDELAVLAASCPVGKGLWGRKPKQDKGMFWIQCGIFPEKLSLTQAKLIYEKISTDVWLKPEGNSYRCLIGPYESFKKASAESKQVKTLSAYKESFVRWVTKDGKTEAVTKAKKPAAKKKRTPKKVVKANTAPKPATKPVVSVVEKKVKPVRKISPAPKTAEPAVQPTARAESKTGGVVFRRKADIAGKLFVVPFLEKSKEQYYMEHGVQWNRLDYEKALKVCSSQGMSLLDEQQWKTLLSSGEMERHKWPMHLPYWGKDKRGLFYGGKVTHLTGTSLLNVACVK